MNGMGGDEWGVLGMSGMEWGFKVLSYFTSISSFKVKTIIILFLFTYRPTLQQFAVCTHPALVALEDPLFHQLPLPSYSHHIPRRRPTTVLLVEEET